jgi:hypothetical protein
MLGVFLMRLQQALAASDGDAQVGIEGAAKNYKKLDAISYSREGIPLLALKSVN